jgi:hypothetical protein
MLLIEKTCYCQKKIKIEKTLCKIRKFWLKNIFFLYNLIHFFSFDYLFELWYNKKKWF